MQRIKSGQLQRASFNFCWSPYAPDTRSPPPEADAHQSRREGSLNLWNELQLGARRAVSRGWRQQSGARDESARRRRRPARRVQRHSSRQVTILVECMPHERLGHTARVFVRNRAGQEVSSLAGGTEPQRQRLARGAARADRRNWTDQLRA